MALQDPILMVSHSSQRLPVYDAVSQDQQALQTDQPMSRPKTIRQFWKNLGTKLLTPRQVTLRHSFH